jgi:hypothetical protein
VRKLDLQGILVAVLSIAVGSNALAREPHESEPHARAQGGGGTPGIFEPPEDTEQPDPALPPGTIVVDLLDGDNQPVTREMVTLGILINSIAKGDSRKHTMELTNDHGRAVFTGLETASNIAYRVSSGFQGGAFAATPFQLEQAKAMHVGLHVYPVTHDIQQALVVSEVTVAAEVREDRIQFEEVVNIYNLGRTAWQPESLRMALPRGFTALSAQASMSDQRVDEADGAAALKGTFPPGRHAVDFRWQLPWSGDKDFDFEVGLPPHVAVARVMMPASRDIQLIANGFPPAETRHDTQGQKFLVTERHLRPEDARLTALAIGIHGLPTPGLGRLVATLLAACAVAAGLTLSFSRRSRLGKADSDATRSALLELLADLERARMTGAVGPKTYERTRRELVHALAGWLSTTGTTNVRAPG